MRCVVCNSDNIQKKKVHEEIYLDNDIILVPIETLVCLSCGERYYDRRTMKYLEEIEKRIKSNEIALEPVGQVKIATIGG